MILTEGDLPDPSRFTRFHPFIKGVFSQWHPTPFEIDGETFNCAEQWMMLSKARLFGDEAAARAILATDDPGVQKRAGQSVAGFETTVWEQWKVDIVWRGNVAKFAANPGAARQLRATGDAMLVEANPRDWIWGVGLAVDDPAVHDFAEWKGGNLLGRILTKVREELA
jgi:ribA/ribD-fused uncharacterized protein